MAIVGECVRVLVLMHSLSKDSGYERGLIGMLLEGILLVLSASEDNFSPVFFLFKSVGYCLI